MKKPIITLILLCSALFFAGAQEITNTLQVLGAYYFPSSEGYGQDGGLIPVDYIPVEKEEAAASVNTAVDPGRSIGSVWGGAKMKAAFNHIRKYPFLQSSAPFMDTNSAVFKYTAELSPVSFNLAASVTLTPVAFLTAQTGAAAGTGWTAGFNGLGRNLPGPNESSIRSEPFSGIVWRVWQTASVQFDLAVLLPGEWNHIVGAASGKVEYKANTNADKDEAWQYEADSGENFNGVRYYGTYFIGYRMPLKLDTVGILVETESWLGNNARRSTLDNDGWGSDFTRVTFGPMFNLVWSDASSAAILVQFQNGIDYTDETVGYRYFEYREAEGTYLKFHRIALQYTYRLQG